MKYMEKGGFQTQPLMRLTLLWTVILLTGFWVTNFFFYFSKMGLKPQSVADYYRGSEALFTQPRSFQSMIEITHSHLAMMAFVMLLLTHLILFAPYRHRTKVILVSLAFGSALLNEGAGWLVRFVHPGFAALKIAGFLALQGTLAYLLVGLATFLLRAPNEDSPRPRKRRDADSTET